MQTHARSNGFASPQQSPKRAFEHTWSPSTHQNLTETGERSVESTSYSLATSSVPSGATGAVKVEGSETPSHHQSFGAVDMQPNMLLAGKANGHYDGDGVYAALQEDRKPDHLAGRSQPLPAESSAMGAMREAAAAVPGTAKLVKLENTAASDTDQFLKFETEEDKRSLSPVKKERVQESRSPSPNPGDGDGDEAEEVDEKPKAKPGEPRSIAHLPVAEEEAMDSFEELEFSVYQNKQIGLAHQQEESMQCECQFDPEVDDPILACGEGSGCINRLTQVECVVGDCRCKGHCQNQRFQKRQFAPIEIVQTEKKGFGMRAKRDIDREAFIYEYVGDVVGEKKFQQRMQDYYDEGIEHFYFMMLQNGEFIDATKRGGKGRFLNHSCAPNCYVAKWVVGRRIRMGIFAKRKIFAHEELTFNYNVDRYGHEAQKCFCGEPNCVGFIGGKTQTDIGAMDDLYLDALGITDEVDQLRLKGTKKKKSRKLDEDFTPNLTQIALEDAPKVASAMRQATSLRRILTKLLERVIMTEDLAVQRQIMRLHGFSLMSGILHEYPSDNEIILSVLNVLGKWPLLTRNKLMSTKIEGSIIAISEKDDPVIAVPAKGLLDMWSALEVAYRIPKAMREAIESGDESKKRVAELAVQEMFATKRARVEEEVPSEDAIPKFRPEAFEFLTLPPAAPRPKPKPAPVPAPLGWVLLPALPGLDNSPATAHYMCIATKTVVPHYPTAENIMEEAEKHRLANLVDVNDVIAKVRAEADARAALEAANAAAAEEAIAKAKAEKRQVKEFASKEKKMYRLFSTVVVKTMTKYRKYLDSDQFKRRAKEVCQIMCDKEKKSSHFQTDSYDSLPSEREAKLAKYVKEFIQKLLARKGIKPSSSHKSSSHASSSKSYQSHHRSSTHKHRSSMSESSIVPSPATPSSTQPRRDDDEMDAEGDDDLINELVQDATGGSATPDSAKTPQNSHLEAPYLPPEKGMVS